MTKSIDRAFKKIGSKANRDFKRAGGELKKAGGVFKKVGGVARQVARGLDNASNLGQALAPALGPAGMAITGGLTAVNEGVKAGRSLGASGVRFANQSASQAKSDGRAIRRTLLAV